MNGRMFHALMFVMMVVADNENKKRARKILEEDKKITPSSVLRE